MNDSDVNVVEGAVAESLRTQGSIWDGCSKLPVGSVSPAMEEATNIKKRVYDRWMPEANVWDGTGTQSQICFGYTALDKDYLKALQKFIPGNACDPTVQPKTRMDVVTKHYAIVGAQAFAENVWHPDLNQPKTSIHEYFGGLSFVVNYIFDIYQKMPDAKSLIRTAMRQKIRMTPYDNEDILKAYFNDSAAGITENERRGAIAALGASLNDSSREELKKTWLSFEGSEEEFENELWPIIKSSNQKVLDFLGAHTPKRQGPWGRGVYIRLLKELGVEASPEELISWAEERRAELEKTANEVARIIDPSSKKWQDVWNNTNPPDMITDDEKLLAAYQERTPLVMEKYRQIGLIPPNLPGCDVKVKFTDEADENGIPTGACAPAPREASEPGGPRISTFLVTKTHGNTSKQRQHGFFFESLIGHELCGHGVQGHYSCKIPYIISGVGRLLLPGLEGHAFSLELLGWKYGVLKKNLYTLLGILQGRIQRAARILVELKYHLQYPDSNPEQLITFYAEQSAMDEKGSEEDCRRAFASPGAFLAYYLGASLAQSVIELRGESEEKNVIREWCGETGAYLPANFFAFAKGWVAKPQDVGLPQRDMAVKIWETEKQKFVGINPATIVA